MNVRSESIVGDVIGIRFWEGFSLLEVVREAQIQGVDSRDTRGVIGRFNVSSIGDISDDTDGCQDRYGHQKFYDRESPEISFHL